jgi:hypothetical protein
MLVCSRSSGMVSRLSFSRGILTSEPASEATTEPDGLYIRFEPDEEIFGEVVLHFESLAFVARGVALVRRVPVVLIDRIRDLTLTLDTPTANVIFRRKSAISVGFFPLTWSKWMN